MPQGYLTDQQLDGLMAVSTGALQRAAARKFPDMASQMGEFPQAEVVSRDLTAQMEAAYPGAQIDRTPEITISRGEPAPEDTEMPPIDIQRSVPESNEDPDELNAFLSKGMAGRVGPLLARRISQPTTTNEP